MIPDLFCYVNETRIKTILVLFAQWGACSRGRSHRKGVAMTTTEIITKLANELAKYDASFVVQLLMEMDNTPATDEVKTPKNEPTTQEWYDTFRSKSTEVKVLASTVQVTVKRGHADEWHDKLRAAGFSWSRKNRNWWAYLNNEKRAKVAERNAANDAATAGMTAEQKQAYWAARRAARKSA